MVTSVVMDSDDCTTLKEGGSKVDTIASGAGNGDIGAFSSYMDVHTLPDVPGVPPRFSYKVWEQFTIFPTMWMFLLEWSSAPKT